MNVYQILDEDTHLICASTRAEAIAYYEQFAGEIDPDVIVTEIDREKWSKLSVTDDNGITHTLAYEVGDADRERPAFHIGSIES